MFQELCIFGGDMGSPDTFWTYQDESWMQICSKMDKAKGGQNTPRAAGHRLLSKYRLGFDTYGEELDQ